ncbi:MAG: metallophosphoesterase family protein [Planctomycetaceae bacterium]|nr:metallophosphoesterase family protein [Planctomycetaceae bacterium]
MKVLAFSDLHTDLRACQRLVEVARANEVQVAVGAGDFAIMRRGLQPVIDELAKLPCPVVFVPGNGESVDELKAACSGYDLMHVLHGSSVVIGSQVFFGLGYAVPETPFGSWSCDLSEDAAAEMLRDCPSGCVLVSHSPPLGHVDQNSRGEHVGSRTILDTIQRVRPKMVCCGHVHDSWQTTSRVGDVPIYNLGPVGSLLMLDGAEVA